MAITPAERRSYDDRIRDAREDAENRETELAKRKNSEIKNLEKKHQEEIHRITDDYQKQLEDVQARSRETLSERDVKHREDMAEVKDAYLGQLRKKMEDSAMQRRELEDTYRSEIQHQKSISKGQADNLTSKQSAELAERDARLRDTIQEVRVQANRNVEDDRNRLNEAHEKEKTLMVKDRDEALLRRDREMRDVVKAYKTQVSDERRQRADLNGRLNQKYYDTVQGLEERHSEALKSKDELLRSAVANQHEKFETRWERKNDEIDAANENFRQSVEDRQNTQVRSRDTKIRNLENKLNNEIVNDERQRGLDRMGLAQAYQKRAEDLERQKNEMADRFRELGDSRVNNVLRKNDEVLRNADRDRRIESSMTASRNREERNILVEQQRGQLDQVRRSAGKQVKAAEKAALDQTKSLSNFYGDSLEQLKSGYADRVDEQRERQLEDQTKLTNVMTNRFRDAENRYQERLDQKTENYENKIAQMRDDQDKEKRRIEDTYAQRMKEKEKSHQFEKESLTQKYEARLAVSEDRHKDEIDRLNRKHEEEIRNVATRVNYSRKA